MTAEDLKGLLDCHAQIKSLERRLGRLREASTMPPPMRLSFAPRGTGSSDPVGEGVARLVELEAELLQKIAGLEEHIRCVEAEIDALPPRERSVLRARYVDGLSWREVAKKTHYSMDHCKRINRDCISH